MEAGECKKVRRKKEIDPIMVGHRPLLKGGPTGLGGGGGWVGPWPVGGWVSLVLGNLAQRAYSPPGGGVGSGWVGGWVGRGWVGPDSRTGALG